MNSSLVCIFSECIYVYLCILFICMYVYVSESGSSTSCQDDALPFEINVIVKTSLYILYVTTTATWKRKPGAASN